MMSKEITNEVFGIIDESLQIKRSCTHEEFNNLVSAAVILKSEVKQLQLENNRLLKAIDSLS